MADHQMAPEVMTFYASTIDESTRLSSTADGRLERVLAFGHAFSCVPGQAVRDVVLVAAGSPHARPGVCTSPQNPSTANAEASDFYISSNFGRVTCLRCWSGREHRNALAVHGTAEPADEQG
ncbi:hypothetical protein ACH4TX_26750 [Streptomyces sp. NPDC021098]|uniref:hypothetical protein n=1 Tax=unclassified Streptomyces TaxID=2593676 RepID=UPI0037A91E8C